MYNMLNTIEERITFVKELKSKIEHEFTDNNYQVFVFGSFLTEEYTPDKSDIDIGIYCESIALAIDMKHFIEEELNKIKLDNDIIIMELTDNSYMNIPIFMYGEPLFNYIREEFIVNLKSLISKWGTNPFEKLSNIDLQ